MIDVLMILLMVSFFAISCATPTGAKRNAKTISSTNNFTDFIVASLLLFGPAAYWSFHFRYFDFAQYRL